MLFLFKISPHSFIMPLVANTTLTPSPGILAIPRSANLIRKPLVAAT